MSATAMADQIRLKDGTEFSATVVGKDGEYAVVALPRSDIASVNGQVLPAPVAVGAVAPDFEAVDLAGTPHRLADAKGQVTLLKFWATWCPHCRADISLMKELFSRYHDKGLRMLAVSVDQDLGQLRSFVEKEQLRYAVIPVHSPSASTQQARLPELYETQGVPAYYLIDAQGLIARIISGSVTEGRVDLESDVKRLLAADTTQHDT